MVHQVSDLEKASEQIDTVGDSRKALSEEWTGRRMLHCGSWLRKQLA
jgi:hypothetical protein